MLIHKNPDAVAPARVVMLGAGGFVAPELSKVLESAGISVRSLGSRELDLTANGSEVQLARLVQATDAIVMSAALTPDKGRDIGTLMKNLRMAENVCAAMAKSAPAHFVYISSDAVYDARSSSLLNEDSSCEPADLYALMHTAREKMTAQTCRAAGVSLAIVRPCAVYGAGDTHNSYGPNRFIRTAQKDGKITLFGEGEERRHHIHVADLARILHLCLLHRSSGTINAVTGEALSFREVAEMIRADAGRPVALECLPRGSAITHRHFDLTALTRAFPNFAPVPFPSGIRQMIREVAALK
jgi:nucleoside-diphosphate-sugar epimerase